MTKEPIPLTAPFYRPETFSPPQRVNFVLNHGGIGDYICWLTSLEWTAKYFPNVKGVIYAPDFFIDIPKIVFAKYSNFTVLSKTKLGEQADEKTNQFKNPTFLPDKNATLNCTGSNLVDLGFAYYCNRQFAPRYHKNYCTLDPASLPINKVNDGPYAVLTPYYTNENRKLGAKAFNGAVTHLLEKNIRPVLLGKQSWAERNIATDEGYDYTGCLDLTNETSVVEAAAVINGAELIMGVDNGLLHLAGMLETPIIFGYTIIGPEFRRPRREKGMIVDIVPNSETLSCTGCLSNMRFHFNHDFNTCIYKDNACVVHLDDPSLWNEGIDLILKEKMQ
jgi:ADP-heptose:LPS heptosyltransferase